MTACRKQGVEIRLGTEAKAEDIIALSPAATLIASGGKPIVPASIPGVKGKNVFSAPEVIHGKRFPEVGKSVVIGSGLTGLETAEILCEHGNTVTVLEMADEIAPGAWFQLIDDELSRLKPKGVTFLTGSKLVEIKEGSIVVSSTKTGDKSDIPADSVVLSMGVAPVNKLHRELMDKLPQVHCIGDAVSSGTIANAVKSAYTTAMKIY